MCEPVCEPSGRRRRYGDFYERLAASVKRGEKFLKKKEKEQPKTKRERERERENDKRENQETKDPMENPVKLDNQ